MTYAIDVEDGTRPRESDGVGQAAGELRAIKRRLKQAWDSISPLTSAFSTLREEVEASLEATETYIAGETTGLIGQIQPFVRGNTADLESWAYCDGRFIGPDASDADPVHANPDLSGDNYKKLFQHTWEMLEASRAEWVALGGTGICPIKTGYWDAGLTAWIDTEFPDPATVPTWEDAWNHPDRIWAVPLPNMRGRMVRGANPYDGVNAIPAATDPGTVLTRHPDYGRLRGSYQAASLLAGDNTSGGQSTSFDNIDSVDNNGVPIRELLGWDKVGADLAADGYPYGNVDPDSDLAASERMRVVQATGTVFPGSNPSVNRPLVYEQFLGAARVDNISLPYYIRFR